MTRAFALTLACLLVLSSPLLHGQQTPTPVIIVPPADDSTPAPAADDTPAPVVDQKTKLPLTPAEQRDREIDKYDPLKPADSTTSDANPLSDRELPTGPASAKQPANTGADAPLPGSIAASNGAAAGTVSSRSLSPDTADYSGPAVLTRAYTLSRPIDSQQVKWTLGLGLTWSDDIGQNGTVNAQGTYVSSRTVGYGVNWSLSGRHNWKFDNLGVAYSANYSDYSGANALTGLNSSLNLDFTHIVSRKLSLHAVESLQLLSQNYALENPTLAAGSSLANINLATSPNLQILDNSVRQSGSTLSLTYHESNRLSYDLSGSYFVIGRSGQNFIGTFGYQLSSDVNYRLTPKATLGGFVSYSDYRYSHNVETSDSLGGGGIFSYSLSRSTQVRTRFGATRIESLGYASVPLPLELAAILGQAVATINAYTLRWTSDVSVQLVRDFRRNRTGSISYTHGEAPGNGVLLTSTQQAISASYAARLLRRFPASVSAVYSSLNSISQGNIGYYNSETYSFAISRDIRKGLNSSFHIDYRRYSISNSPLLQHDLRITVGLTWSPPENSLRF